MIDGDDDDDEDPEVFGYLQRFERRKELVKVGGKKESENMTALTEPNLVALGA